MTTTADQRRELGCSACCDYCQPDAWHDCMLPAGHEGYHSCTGYVA